MQNEHDELRSLLARIRRRWFGFTALTTIGRATAAASIPLAAAAAIVWAAAPLGWRLVAVLAIACAVAAAAVVRVLVRMQRRPDDCRVARFVEESTGASGLTPVACDTLVSAVEVLEAPDRHSGVFAGLLVRQAVELLREIDPASVISSASLRRAAGQAAVGAALLGLTLAAIAPGLLHAGATVWVAAFPRSIGIQVLTGNVRVPAGQPLRLSAAVTGRSARLLSVAPSLVVSANGEQRTVPMTAAGGTFSYSFESVDRSFQYRVVAGSAASDAFAVTAVSPPKVQSIDVSYTYPSFTGLSPREDKDGGDVYAPAGTRVRLQIHADKPLAGGELRLAGGRPVRLATDNDSASAELVLAKDDAYRVRLADRDGLGVDRRRRVLHSRDGRSSAGGAHRAAERRSGDHAARGSRDRSARRRRLRDRTTRAGLRRRRPSGEDGAFHAPLGDSRGADRGASARRRRSRACSRATSSPTTPGRATSRGRSRRARRRATCSSSR